MSLSETKDSRPADGIIICFGDSITAGYRLKKNESYPYQLGLLLGRTVVGKGISGETSGEALDRLQRDVLDKRPKLAIIQFGGNDVMCQADPAETLANIDSMAGQAQAVGATPVLLIGDFRVLAPAYLDGLRNIARQRNIVLIENAVDHIIQDPAMSMDGAHPTAEGSRILAEKVAAAVRPLLK